MKKHKMDERVGAKMRRQMGYLSRREAASMCDLNIWTFYALIARGAISRPVHRLKKSRYYSSKDIEDIKEILTKEEEE